MQWGLALNPNQNDGIQVCEKWAKFCEKVPFLVLRKKKRKEATKTFVLK